MPLASPSSLTSNTLATFLDHVPISTNNAEKWKPKHMDSNSGGDYWSLSRALCVPLGTENWIPHCLFLSAGTKVGGRKAVAAMCLHVSGGEVQMVTASTEWDNLTESTLTVLQTLLWFPFLFCPDLPDKSPCELWRYVTGNVAGLLCFHKGALLIFKITQVSFSLRSKVMTLRYFF